MVSSELACISYLIQSLRCFVYAVFFIYNDIGDESLWRENKSKQFLPSVFFELMSEKTLKSAYVSFSITSLVKTLKKIYYCMVSEKQKILHIHFDKAIPIRIFPTSIIKLVLYHFCRS